MLRAREAPWEDELAEEAVEAIDAVCHGGIAQRAVAERARGLAAEERARRAKRRGRRLELEDGENRQIDAEADLHNFRRPEAVVEVEDSDVYPARPIDEQGFGVDRGRCTQRALAAGCETVFEMFKVEPTRHTTTHEMALHQAGKVESCGLGQRPEPAGRVPWMPAAVPQILT